jgi:hypothetical protein
MELNRPDVVAEVEGLFQQYEAALVSNDIPVLDHFFWVSPHAVRFGISENLYGHDAIARFRRDRNGTDLARELVTTVITTYGSDLATVSAEFRRAATGRCGRQSQTWVRFEEGWRIVAGHVSLL